jgi:hypothetical protein
MDPAPQRGYPPSALPRVEECTYFWGVNTSWGIDTAESKGPLHQEDNQAPQPTCRLSYGINPFKDEVLCDVYPLNFLIFFWDNHIYGNVMLYMILGLAVLLLL